MGIIQTQTIRSSIYIFIGFIIGAVNILILFPAFFSQAEIGMTRALMDISLTLSTLATLGSLPVIYKFYPFYKDYLEKNKNDLPFITGMVCLFGFLLVLIAGWLFQDLIVRKLGKSPEFSQYFYLVYPYTFLLMAFLWLEAFAWGFKKTTLTNFAKETLMRVTVTVMIILFATGMVNMQGFMKMYGFLFLLPVFFVSIVLIRSGWKLNLIKPSRVTQRLGKRMLRFGILIFSAQFLNVFARTSDTIFAIGFQGLSQAGLFAIGSYLVAVMEIPQRSMTSISVPVLAEAWKNRDMISIKSIYGKSVSNLLVIGTGVFSLIMLNTPDLVEILNHFGRRSNADYSVLVQIVLFMGLARVIDLGTGINSQIIGTSNFWNFDFYTNVLYTILSIPLNFILIKKFGIVGLAYANLIALSIYNLVRYIFLRRKFDLQPYNMKNFYAVLFAAGAFGIAWIIPLNINWWFAIVIRSAIFCILFIPAVFYGQLAPELTQLAESYISKFRRKN